jgi:raffinose/stachyose/melibiose transport system substrate-binding protein
VALSACSPSSPSSSSPGQGDSKNVTLSVWSWRTEDVAAYKKIFGSCDASVGRFLGC